MGLGTVECMGEANLGELALRRGDPGAARPHFERALALARRIHFRVVEATALTNLASLALADGWVLVGAGSEGYPAGTEVVIRPWP